MVALLHLIACPECPTNVAARAWVLSGSFLPTVMLLMLPLGLTLGAAALVYGLQREQ